MTLVEPALFTPQSLDHPDRPLGLWRLLRTLVHNPLETWPQPLFTERLFWQRFAGRPLLFVMDPDARRRDAGRQGRRLPQGADHPPHHRSGGRQRFDLHRRGRAVALAAPGRRAAVPPFATILGFVPAFHAAAARTAADLQVDAAARRWTSPS
jgi:hypothetical protein